MPSRGRFVCHVHCLVHDGAIRSSPCRPHHENFGRNLYHMFVPAYSASQSFVLFWVVVFELLRSQELIPYLLLSGVSPISMWIPILHDNRDCHVNPFQPVCFSSSESDHFNIRKIKYQFFSTVFVSSVPKLPLFSCPPTLISSRIRIYYSSIILFLWSLFILFFECSTRWFSWRCSSSSSFFILFFSGGFNSSFWC